MQGRVVTSIMLQIEMLISTPSKTKLYAVCLGVMLTAIIVLFVFFGKPAGEANTIYFNGEIDSKLVQLLHDADMSIKKRIVIDSGGGNVQAALEAAEIIRANRLQVVVDGYCLSACAEIILAAGTENIVKPGSLVAFHNLAGMWYYLDDYTRTHHDISLRNSIGYSLAAQTVSLYKKSGLNPDIFVAAALRKGALCIGNLENDDPDARIFIRFTTEMYIPNEKSLNQFGWQFQKFSPEEDMVEFNKKIELLFSKNLELNFHIEDREFEFPDTLTGGDVQFTRFEEC